MKNTNQDFKSMTDEEIVVLAQEANGEAVEYLLNKYKNLVRTKARSFFILGAENEDLIQEGMIGLYKAIRDYKADKNVYFGAFANLCIRRQIITALKSATRLKHNPLNSYISLNKAMFDEESERTLLDVIDTANGRNNPEEMFISREEIQTVNKRMQEILSKLELQVLDLYMEGKSYQETADILNKEVKSVDNALQRIKRKVEKEVINQKLSLGARNI